MTENNESQHHYSLDAIAAVAHQGEKRFRLISLGVFIVVLVIFGIVLIKQMNRLPELATLPVAILIPSKDSGSAQDNAQRQWEGFQLAFSENHISDDLKSHYYYFNYPLKTGGVEEPNACGTNAIETLAEQSGFDAMLRKFNCWRTREDIGACDAESIGQLTEESDLKAMLQQVKCWYHKDRIRTFIITMSAAATKFKPVFEEWAGTLKPGDRPVLLATVASAPNIAERENGVFRHYIRSRDESETLATYIESMKPYPKSVGIFHVPDDYGREAKNLLKTRLEQMRLNVGAYVVPFDEAPPAEETQRAFGTFLEHRNDVAVIIGYGSMIKNTLNLLKEFRVLFNGPILVVSTFTEDRWRPEWTEDDDDCFIDQIRYIEPITEKEETEPDRRGVVYQFSYLTLDRALKCKDKRGVEDFWNCFRSVTEFSPSGLIWNPNIEFTEDGDSHISLRLLDFFGNEELTAACKLELERELEPEPEPPPE